VRLVRLLMMFTSFLLLFCVDFVKIGLGDEGWADTALLRRCAAGS
jgi:hypothetical protein